jgi:cell division septation protein DedD
MRRSAALALITLLGLAGCRDEPEAPPAAAPAAPLAERAPDTAAGDPAGTPAPAAEDPADEPVAGAGEQLFTVQIGAFREHETARRWAQRLEGQGFPVWTSVLEQRGETLYRVRVGALQTVEEANRLAAMLTRRYGGGVWVARMAPTDRAPEDALEQTRRVLGGA